MARQAAGHGRPDHPRLHPILWRELRKIEELDLLAVGEILCEQEYVTFDTDPGALIVTDRRVLFVSTTALGGKTDVLSVSLNEVDTVLATSSRWLWRLHGALTLGRTSYGDAAQLKFQRISGGVQRAKEIASTILRQQELLKA